MAFAYKRKRRQRKAKAHPDKLKPAQAALVGSLFPAFCCKGTEKK